MCVSIKESNGCTAQMKNSEDKHQRLFCLLNNGGVEKKTKLDLGGGGGGGGIIYSPTCSSIYDIPHNFYNGKHYNTELHTLYMRHTYHRILEGVDNAPWLPLLKELCLLPSPELEGIWQVLDCL